jgi:hypothetical protein
MVMQVVMEVGWIQLLIMYKKMDWLWERIIHIQQQMDHAKMLAETSKE